MKSSDASVTGGCGQTSATSRHSTMPSPPSTRPNESTERRSFAFGNDEPPKRRRRTRRGPPRLAQYVYCRSMSFESAKKSGPTRRGLLLTAASAAAAAGGVLAASPADAAGRTSSRPEVFVLVHGANGSAGVWSGVADLLAARGHLVFAVDLPGHGAEGWFPAAYQAPQDLDALSTLVSPLNGVKPPDYVAHVVA